MKHHKQTLHGVRLLALSTLVLLFSSISALAAEVSAQPASNPYQSTFDDYKSLADNSLADWKTSNSNSDGGGHASHSMQGMQHQMSSEPMAKMSSSGQEMPAMESMNHGDMKAMDHSQMQHDHTMAPMEGMDHSKMAGMHHDEMKSMPSNTLPAMQQMDHAQIQPMQHGTHDHQKPEMITMHDSASGEMQHNQDATAPDEAAPHAHASEQNHDHAEMAMPSDVASSTQTAAQTQHWQIIPNLHPVIVHFPIALTLVAFLLSFAAYVRRSHPISAQLRAAGHFMLWLAAISAATAVLFGWLAYNSVNHDDAGHAAMLLHRAWAVPTAIGLVLVAIWDAWKHRTNELMSPPTLILLFILSGTIGVTGWLGGEVVYRHGIGVLSLPVSQGTGHSHHHHDDSESATHLHGATEIAPVEYAEHHHDDAEGETHEH